MKVVVQGPEIEVWVGGVKYIDHVDHTYTSGKVGFYRQGTGAAFRNANVTSYYSSAGYFISTTISEAGNIKSATPTITETLGGSGSLSLFVSNNNGTTYEQVDDAETIEFTTEGTQFKYKLYLSTSDTTFSPFVDSISFNLGGGTLDSSNSLKHQDFAQYGGSLGNSHRNEDNYDYTKLSLKATVTDEDVVHSGGTIVKRAADDVVLYYINSSAYQLVAYD